MTAPQSPSSLRQNVAKGILFMCLAILIMPMMNSMAKALTVDYPLFMVVWARAAGHFVSMAIVFWPGRGWRLFKTAKPKHAAGALRRHVRLELQLYRRAFNRGVGDGVGHHVYRAVDGDRALATLSRRTRWHPPVERGYRRFLGRVDHHTPRPGHADFRCDGLGLDPADVLGSEFCDLSNFDAKTFRAGFGGDNERLHAAGRHRGFKFGDAVYHRLAAEWHGLGAFYLGRGVRRVHAVFRDEIPGTGAGFRRLALSVRRIVDRRYPWLCDLWRFSRPLDLGRRRRHCGKRRLYRLSGRCVGEEVNRMKDRTWGRRRFENDYFPGQTSGQIFEYPRMTEAIRIDPKTGLKVFNTRAAKLTAKINGKGYSEIEDETLTTLPPPPPGAVFNAAEQAKYREFKEARAGAADYMEMEGEFSRYLEDVYSEPPVEREALDDECDILVVGGGFGALLLWYKLRKAGFTDVRFCEKGGDVGGTWYWNRYPGIACDVESYSYLPLLEEMEYFPTMKFASGFEILEYCQSMAEQVRFLRSLSIPHHSRADGLG